MQSHVSENWVVYLHDYKPQCQFVQLWNSEELKSGFVYHTETSAVAWFPHGGYLYFQKGTQFSHWYFDFVDQQQFIDKDTAIDYAFKARDPDKIFTLLAGVLTDVENNFG